MLYRKIILLFLLTLNISMWAFIIWSINGCPLSIALKDTSNIKYKTQEIVKSCKRETTKAEKISKWVNTNLVYNTDKANKTGFFQRMARTGGRYAYYNREDCICSEYSCLFYIMCRDAGLKVRLCTGKFEGGGHAWNEVWLNNKWVLFDPTNSKESVGNNKDYVKSFTTRCREFIDRVI